MKLRRRIWRLLGRAYRSHWTEVVLWVYVTTTFTITNLGTEEVWSNWWAFLTAWSGVLLVASLRKIRRERLDLIDDAIKRLSGGDDNKRELLPGEILQPRPSQVRK